MAVELNSIKNAHLFSKLHEEEQWKLARACNTRNYRNGDLIFSEGEEGKALYIVKSGIVTIVKKIETTMGENETQTLATLRSGEFFGEFTFFIKGTHSASAVADGEVSLIVLERDDFNKMALDDPTLGYRIMREVTIFMGELLRKMNKRFTSLVDFMWNGKRQTKVG